MTQHPAHYLRLEPDTSMWNEGFEHAGVWMELCVPDDQAVMLVQKIVESWNSSHDWGSQFVVLRIPYKVIAPRNQIIVMSAEIERTVLARLEEWSGH